jgi:hypothetical protein
MQLEANPVASAYQHEDPALALQRVQRFVETSYDLNVAPGTATNSGRSLIQMGSAGSQAALSVTFKVKKRCGPEITLYSPVSGANGKAHDYVNNADVTARVIDSGQGGFAWQASPGSRGSDVLLATHWLAECGL